MAYRAEQAVATGEFLDDFPTVFIRYGLLAAVSKRWLSLKGHLWSVLPIVGLEGALGALFAV